MLTHEYLKLILHYDKETGIFTWLEKLSRRINIGSKAGKMLNDYRSIRINGKDYSEHRLAWFYVYGVWPENDIDHKDTNKINNKFDNLRIASKMQNKMNIGKNKNNTSGFKGISWDKDSNKWLAQIQINCKKIWLGVFNSIEEAREVYTKYAKEYQHKFYNKLLDNIK